MQVIRWINKGLLRGLSLVTNNIYNHILMCPHVCLVAKLCLTLQPHGFICPWDSPGKNTGVGCHFLLQGIFCSKGSNLVSCIFCIGRWILYHWASPQFSSVAQLCPNICDPMDCSMPGLPVNHQHLELTQTHTHHVSDTIQPDHPLSSPSSPALNLCQHQGLFKWVNSLHEVAKVLEFQLQHQSFQRIF